MLDHPGAASARIYDYSLGGKDNYGADRHAAMAALAAHRAARLLPRENRKFMRRAVRYLLDAGVRQFIDVGCGLPGKGNVHELAHRADPDSRTVYVDNDPVAVVHYQALLHAVPTAAAVRGDARRAADVLADPDVTALIDLDRPVGVLMIAMLDQIPEADDPDGVVRTFRDAMAPGSHLAICDLASDRLTPADFDKHEKIVELLGFPVEFRPASRLGGFFDGLDLVDPGLVPAPEWRPDRPYDPPSGWLMAGVGRKP
ncbi:SAM-dependent methyltransferase [Actinomadura algeriensis]|uniref:S-adenosyl methyltransferase n=1 Tax=Actinomadura algeriensis TaxID=1679523 RepID=A0ABR9K3S6_9ACTN|nr:SAM-dependent methyltransferase [Actinomadura algeriensis]MBE1537482.1 hypothetical protein [Actinomadura algeriensis]